MVMESGLVGKEEEDRLGIWEENVCEQSFRAGTRSNSLHEPGVSARRETPMYGELVEAVMTVGELDNGRG